MIINIRLVASCWFISLHSIILSVVSYVCETWSLALSEERRQSLSKNRVLRRIFGPKRNEETEEWRKLHNEEFNDLYTSPNIVRAIESKKKMRWTVQVEHMGERRGVQKVLVGKPEGKRPLGRFRRRWKDNIKMALRDVGLAQGRDGWWAQVNVILYVRVP